MTWKKRYAQSYSAFQLREYSAARIFGCLKPNYPDCQRANGLTRMICQWLTWEGHRATRIASSGRLIDTAKRQPSGISLQTKKWITGPTRRGAADISSTIKLKSGIGISVMWEIKVGKDTPSEYQLREQAKEISAGGQYFFVHTPEEFFVIYDNLLSSFDGSGR